MNTLTLITGLPGAGKSTLGEKLEHLAGSQIVHCDFDFAFQAVIENDKMLSRIGSGYIPEKERLPFLLGDRQGIVRALSADNQLFALFQAGVLKVSIDLLRTVQATQQRAFGVISADGTTRLSREMMGKIGKLEGYENVNAIELSAPRKVLLDVAYERQSQEKGKMHIITPGFNREALITKKSPKEVVKSIQAHQPYDHTREGLFGKHLRVERSTLDVQRLHDWIICK